VHWFRLIHVDSIAVLARRVALRVKLLVREIKRMWVRFPVEAWNTQFPRVKQEIYLQFFRSTKTFTFYLYSVDELILAYTFCENLLSCGASE
jgi:hypothetical protein